MKGAMKSLRLRGLLDIPANLQTDKLAILQLMPPEKIERF
jgi:hypothetical protein